MFDVFPTWTNLDGVRYSAVATTNPGHAVEMLEYVCPNLCTAPRKFSFPSAVVEHLRADRTVQHFAGKALQQEHQKEKFLRLMWSS